MRWWQNGAAVAAIALLMPPAMAAQAAPSTPGLIPQKLPAGVPDLFGITCPTTLICYAAGGDQTTSAVIVSTTDGGASWQTQRISGSIALGNVACTSPTKCVVVGLGATPQVGAVYTTRDGRTWTEQAVPSGTGLLQAVTCPDRTDCLAGGGSVGSGSTFIVSGDGAITWSDGAIPLQSGISDLTCFDAGHCWAAGLNGLYLSTDLGATWQKRGPTDDQLLPADCLTPIPAGGFGSPDCISFYDYVDFPDARHGWLVAEGKGLGRGPSLGTSRVFRTSDGGASWQRWTPPPSFPLTSTAPFREMAALTCIGTACTGVADVVDSTGNSTTSEIVVSSDGQAWHAVASPSVYLTSIACPSASVCFSTGDAGGTGMIFGGLHAGSAPGTVPTQPSGSAPGTTLHANPDQSALATSLLTPRAAFSSGSTVAVNALVVLALVMLVVFPSQLFNHTFEENHDEIRAAWRRRLAWTARPRARAEGRSARRGAVAFAVVLVVGALLASLLDPRVGVNAHTAALVLGVATSITIGVTVGALVGVAYRRARRQPVAWALHALPSGLLVAAACVLISRLTSFTPGYLYGIIGGVAFAGELTRHQTGHLVALTSTATLVVAALAWLAWVPVDAAASKPGAGFGLALLENVLASLFVGGLVGTLVGLIPLRFLPGHKLAAWHWLAWTAVFALAAFGLVQIMLRPQSSGAHVNGVAFWTTAALFLAFGCASVLFWAYFRVRASRRVPSEA